MKENILTIFALYGVISFTRDIILVLRKNKYFNLAYKELETMNDIRSETSETSEASSIESLIIINDISSESESEISYLRKRRRI
jgi:hypothetical protein